MMRAIKQASVACCLLAAVPAAHAACTGTVTFGEGAALVATTVPNKEFRGKCFNQLIVDTVVEGAKWDSEAEFVLDTAGRALEWLLARLINGHQVGELLRGAVQSEVGRTITVRVIGFNDFHGNLQSPGTFGINLNVPPAQRPAVGGGEFLAAHIARLKSANPLNAVVGAGDFIGASPLISALFNDEPTVEVLNRAGVDFSSVGNHEFDKGSAELLRLQNGGCKADGTGCKGAQVGTPVPFEGAKFKWLSANVVVTATGKTLLPAYGIKKFGKAEVAFIGMTLQNTPQIVTPSGVAGLEFRDEADTVNALVPRLRKEGAQAVVVLVHEGGFQSAGISDINGCDGGLAGSAIAEIVPRMSDEVDAVVSGHTHAAYNCMLPTAGGRLIPVTSASAFGRILTTLDLVIETKKHEVVSVTANNVLVDRTDATVTPNAQIASIISAYNGLVSPISNQVIGAFTGPGDLPNTAIDNACNMPAGDLIADAMLDATAAPDFGGAAFALMNRGGVRNPGFIFASSAAGEGNGNITYGEAFTVQPFGNTLVTVTLTTQQVKNVLEEQFAGCRGQLATATRIMLPSAGFSYAWDGSKACDQRVSNAKLVRGAVTETLVDAAGVVQDPLKPWRVTINNFMATGGDGYSTFLASTGQLGGAQDIDALVAYMADFKAPNAPYDPAAASLGKPRIARINAPVGSTACPGGAITNP